MVHCKCITKTILKRARISFSNIVHFRGKHAWYRALACVYLKPAGSFQLLHFFFFNFALSSNYLKGNCWNMYFKYGKKKKSVYCFILNKNKSTIANTKNVLNFVVILHSCTSQNVITAKGLKLGNEIFL